MEDILGVVLLVGGIITLVCAVDVLMTPSDVWKRNNLIQAKIKNGANLDDEELLGLVKSNVCFNTMTVTKELTVLAMSRKENYGR